VLFIYPQLDGQLIELEMTTDMNIFRVEWVCPVHPSTQWSLFATELEGPNCGHEYVSIRLSSYRARTGYSIALPDCVVVVSAGFQVLVTGVVDCWGGWWFNGLYYRLIGYVRGGFASFKLAYCIEIAGLWGLYGTFRLPSVVI